MASQYSEDKKGCEQLSLIILCFKKKKKKAYDTLSGFHASCMWPKEPVHSNSTSTDDVPHTVSPKWYWDRGHPSTLSTQAFPTTVLNDQVLPVSYTQLKLSFPILCTPKFFYSVQKEHFLAKYWFFKCQNVKMDNGDRNHLMIFSKDEINLHSLCRAKKLLLWDLALTVPPTTTKK